MRNGLYRNPGGRVWLYEFRYKGVKYKGSTGTESKPRAELWLRTYRDDLSAEDRGIPVPKAAPTLEKILEEWILANTAICSAKHVRSVKDALEHHAQPLLELPADLITTELVDGIRDEYLKGGATSKAGNVRPHTAGGANDLLKHLLAVVRWAVEDRGYLARIPFKVNPAPVQEVARPVLADAQVEAFLAEIDQAANDHVHLAVRLMLSLGLREGEALGARWEWVDWNRQEYTVGNAKNKKTRTIPIPPRLLEYLRAIPKKPKSGLMMPTEDKTEHSAQFTTKAIRRAAAVVEITGLHPHRLRATFATSHADAGTPIHKVKELMGHGDITTTDGYFGKSREGMKEAQAKVEARRHDREDKPETVADLLAQMAALQKRLDGLLAAQEKATRSKRPRPVPKDVKVQSQKKKRKTL